MFISNMIGTDEVTGMTDCVVSFLLVVSYKLELHCLAFLSVMLLLSLGVLPKGSYLPLLCF